MSRSIRFQRSANTAMLPFGRGVRRATSPPGAAAIRVSGKTAVVDLLPGLGGCCVDDSGRDEFADRVEAACEVCLVHERLVLEDLSLHGQEGRLEEPQSLIGDVVCGVAPEQGSDGVSAPCDAAIESGDEGAFDVGNDPDVEEARRRRRARSGSPSRPIQGVGSRCRGGRSSRRRAESFAGSRRRRERDPRVTGRSLRTGMRVRARTA